MMVRSSFQLGRTGDGSRKSSRKITKTEKKYNTVFIISLVVNALVFLLLKLKDKHVPFNAVFISKSGFH